MIPKLLSKIFGRNYRTTISGLLTTASIMAAGIVLDPSSIVGIPEAYKGKVLVWAGIVFCISNIYKSAQTADAKNVNPPKQ